MSRAFVESFFPSLTSQLQSPTNRIRPIYELVLPADVLQSCPEVLVRLDFHGLVIRNPVLLIGSIFGAVFGLYVGLFDTSIGFIPLNVPKKPLGFSPPTSSFWLSVSFLFFGLMNLAAIPLHSFLPVVSPEGVPLKRIPLPQQYPFLWIMDAYCTGVFSSSLILASFNSCRNRFPSTNVIHHRGLLLSILLGVGCLPIARFLLYGSTVELELWYFIPVACCAAFYAFDLFVTPHLWANSSQVLRKHPLDYIYAVVLWLLITGLFLDAPLSRWSMQKHILSSVPWFWDAGRLPAIAFVACDMAFIGLFIERRRNLLASSIREKIH
jgi:hypothetical protein